MCFTVPFPRERQVLSGVWLDRYWPLLEWRTSTPFRLIWSAATTRNRQSTRRSWQLGHLHFTLHLHLKWFWGQAVMLASPADHLNLFMRDLRIMNVFTGLVATQSIYHNCNRLLYMIQWWHPNLHLKWFSDSIFIGNWGAQSKMDFANPVKTGIVSLRAIWRHPIYWSARSVMGSHRWPLTTDGMSMHDLLNLLWCKKTWSHVVCHWLIPPHPLPRIPRWFSSPSSSSSVLLKHIPHIEANPHNCMRRIMQDLYSH